MSAHVKGIFTIHGIIKIANSILYFITNIPVYKTWDLCDMLNKKGTFT